MDIIRYGPNRIQIYLSTIKYGFWPPGDLNGTSRIIISYPAHLENRALPYFQPLLRLGSASSRTFGAVKAACGEVESCRASR
jgi:hypothetical protein